MAVTRPHTKETRSEWRRWAIRVGGALVALLALALAACAGSSPTAPSSNQMALTQIPWCDVPAIAFQDDGKLSHPIVSDWSAVQGQLGLTPYLPTALPKGACLVLAGGTIHDPVVVGHFRITYTLPGSGPLSFSELPKQASVPASENGKVECTAEPATGTPVAATGTPGATPIPSLNICVGTIGNTYISIASAQASSDLKHMFTMLQPNVDWLPQEASATQAPPTATPKS